MKTLVVCSGGLDSVTLSYKITKERTHTLSALLSFDYGQRHRKELDYATLCADALGAEHIVMDISCIGKALSGSALIDEIAVPEGHYAEETMKTTIVPNRNAIMLTIAYGVAAAKGLTAVATAVHSGDHFIYPDCRPDFINAFSNMQNHALEGVADIALYTPFLELDKTAIAHEAGLHAVPVAQTWSCYNGGEIHCGRCGTCVERREALELAGIQDPTDYLDRDYWKAAVQNAKKEASA